MIGGVFLLILFTSVLEYFGDSNFKFYARNNDPKNLVIGIAFYTVMVAFLIYTLKYANVMYVNGMWDGISALIETALAYYLLHETLSNSTQYIGLAFIIIGLFSLNYGPIPH